MHSPNRRLHRVLPFAIAACLFLSLSAPDDARAGGSLSVITVDDAAKLIRRARMSRAVVVMLWNPQCPYCYKAYPAVSAIADHYRSKRIEFLAFSTASELAETRSALGTRRWVPANYHLRPWKAGELSKAMKRANVPVGARFSVPYFAVLDRRGKLVKQWTGWGKRGQEKLQEAIEAALAAER